MKAVFIVLVLAFCGCELQVEYAEKEYVSFGEVSQKYVFLYGYPDKEVTYTIDKYQSIEWDYYTTNNVLTIVVIFDKMPSDDVYGWKIKSESHFVHAY